MKDDWEKPRGRGDYLTAREIEAMCKAFNEGRSASDIACELNCSVRIASKYYARFRGGPMARGRPRRESTPMRPERPSRFYTSNFEL